MKHPFIFSFPRSGLHLTAKIINWPLHVNFDGMSDFNYMRQQINKQSKEILFTHQTISMLKDGSLDFILDNCLPIFIVRDPKDALLSWYFMHDKAPDIDETKRIDRIRSFIWSPFLGCPNKILLWKEQIDGFRKDHNRGLVIRYENLIQNYSLESQKISDYLSLPVSLTLPSVKSVELSRKGIINDHVSYFDSKLIDEINSICKEEIEYIDTFLV